MSMRMLNRPSGPSAKKDSADATTRSPRARPGLPVSLSGPGSSSESTQDAEAKARAARDAANVENERAASESDTDAATTSNAASEDKANADGDGENETGEESTDSDTANGEESEAGDAGDADASVGSAAAPNAFPVVRAPPLPMVLLPDMNAIEAPNVPGPPPSVQKKRDEILKTTGRTPDSHHATVQQGVNRVAEVARQAQREIVARIGNIAARTRFDIDRLADMIPVIVNAGVARIRAEAKTVREDVKKIAVQEMNRVAAHVDTAQGDMETSRAQTNRDMQTMLMRDAPDDLKKARERLNAALDGAAVAAKARMLQIPQGVQPGPVSDGVTLNAADRAAADKAAKERQDRLNKEYPHQTFEAASVPLSAKLMLDRPGNRLAQYGNLQCNAALPDMVAEQKRLYTQSNATSADALASDENKARLFDSTFLIGLPISEAFEEDQEGFRDHLDMDVAAQQQQLTDAKISVLRSMDQKLSTVLEEKLNENHKDSLPHQAIKGLRDAGKQIAQGLKDQARQVEASLMSNLARLAEAYPDVVNRLEPMVQNGEFLEATAILSRLAEAEGSIRTLREGHIQSVAEQAQQALAEARDGFDRQAKSLRKQTRNAVTNIQRFGAQAKWDFLRAGVQYTGVIGEGMDQCLPMLHDHATEVARRLLGPKQHKQQSFDNFTTAAIRYLNNVVAAEWEGYLKRVNKLEENLGGVQEGLEGVAGASDGAGATDKQFFKIREGASRDTLARANQIVNALPARPSTGELVLTYAISPVGGAIVHYMTDPDEDEVVSALSIPWPGPWAIHERHGLKDGTAIGAGGGGMTSPLSYVFGGEGGTDSIYGLISSRMDEPERRNALDLFSSSAATRSEAKQALLNASGGLFGISEDTAMALSQSLTAEEVSRDVMSPTDRDRLATNLRSTLSPSNQEIAAAYINNQPDLALALRMRNHFNAMRTRDINQQMDSGKELDAIIQRELFMSGSRGYVPQARLNRMRDAAMIQFGNLVEGRGETPRSNRQVQVTINRNGPAASPRVPLTAGQMPQPPAAPTTLSAGSIRNALSGNTQSSGGNRNQPPTQPTMTRAQRRHQAALARQARERERMLRPATEEEAGQRAQDLEAARQAVIKHVNRPNRLQLARNNPHMQRSVEQRPTLGTGPQSRARTYNPDSGRYEVGLPQAVMAYNAAMLQHGTDSPQAKAAQAVAQLQMREGDAQWTQLSTNDINRLHGAFTDRNYASMRARWAEASPRERVAMRAQWEKAQSDHATFMRHIASGLGMTDGIDDPARVSDFVGNRLGAQFARNDPAALRNAPGFRGRQGETPNPMSFRNVGLQIVNQGRVDIDLGTQLAGGGYGDGTNEDLLQSVISGRRKSEFAQQSRLRPGQTMGQFARNMVNREVDGDAWQQADIALMGIPENDLDHAAIARRRFEHQRHAGTGAIAGFTMSDQSETRWLENSMQDVDARVAAATLAGIDEARSLGGDVSGVTVPDPLRLPNGEWHPDVLRYAMNADGHLRGDGAAMSSLASDVEQTAGFYRAEIDKQEAMLTGAITVLAIIVSVALMFVPGVNAVAAGILTALISGAATIAVKAGMRGSRYGWEEMATDMASTAIEVATAGIGGKLSQGAKLVGTANKGTGLVRVGRALHSAGKFWGPVAQEAVTGAIGGAANAALDDKLWDDGPATGLAKVAGRGAQGALSSAASAAASSMLTTGVQNNLTPDPPKGKDLGNLNRAARRLGPAGREMVEEVISNVGGALSSEAVNFLADLVTYSAQGLSWDEMKKAMGGNAGIAKRFLKTAVKEGASAALKTGAKQHLRQKYQNLAAKLHREGRDPTHEEAILLAHYGKISGMVDDGVSLDDFKDDFSRTRSRMADMPEPLRRAMAGMDPDSARQIIQMMDTGDLGEPADLRKLVDGLARKSPGLDPDSFNEVLTAANESHAPAREARKKAVAETRAQVLSGLSGPERKAIEGLDFEDLVGLEPRVVQNLARRIADAEMGEFSLRFHVSHMLGDDPALADRVAKTVNRAIDRVGKARHEDRVALARVRDELNLAAPERLHPLLKAFSREELETFHRLMTDGSEASRIEATRLLAIADIDLPLHSARAMVNQMADAANMQAARFAHLDNVPPAHRSAMAQLPDDALMELRVAQYQKRRLDPDRIDEIVADVRAKRPGADVAALRDAIDATLAHRHGRPGFREALAQKRAMLSMIPWGMKRQVLRTPVLTLPESAFLSYVRGRGNENAVTLIIDGQPVILMRQGAPVGELAEEGVHVLQSHDPDWRDKVADIDERRMVRWDDMDPQTQVDAYRTKMQIELDAQERIVARLAKRAYGSLWPPNRKRAQAQLDAALDSLDKIKSRLDRADSLTPEQITAMAANPALRPEWLVQPPRIFSKSDITFFHSVLSPGDGETAAKISAIAKGLKSNQKRDLAQMIRAMHGALPEKVVRDIITEFSTDTQGDRVSRLRDRLIDEATQRIDVAQVRERLNRLSGADSAPYPDLIRNVMDTLDSVGANETHALQIVKKGLLLKLATATGKATGRLETLQLIAGVLQAHPGNASAKPSIDPDVANDTHAPGNIEIFKDKPELQAAALEGLTLVKSLHRDDSQSKIASLTDQSFERHLRSVLVGTGDSVPRSYRKAMIRHLSMSYFGGASSLYTERFSHLMRRTMTLNDGITSGRDRINIATMVRFLEDADVGSERTKLVRGMARLIDTLAAQAGQDGVPSAMELGKYITAAGDDPNLERSLTLIAKRALDPDRSLGADEFEAIMKKQPVALDDKRDSFEDKYLKQALSGEDAYHGQKEKLAESLVKALKDGGVELTAVTGRTEDEVLLAAARSIANRMDVLDHSVVVSSVFGKPMSREAYLEEFIGFLKRKSAKSSGSIKASDVDDEFRAFVRRASNHHITLLRSIGTELEIPDGDGKVQRKPLSTGAAAALANVLLRGEIDDDINRLSRSERARKEAGNDPGKKSLVDALPDSIRAEIDAAKAAMRDRFIAAFESGDLKGMGVDEARAHIDRMLEMGIFNVSTSGKGSMMEFMINKMFSAYNRDQMPPELRKMYQVFIAHHSESGDDAAKRTIFRSIDQMLNAPGKSNSRSFDHMFEIAKAKTAGTTDAASIMDPTPENAAALARFGLQPGDKIGVDSKNGEGAFDPDQFKRYMVEMMRAIVVKSGGPRAEDGFSTSITGTYADPVFGGGEKLGAMMYISNNARNMFNSHAKAMKIVDAMLAQAAKTGRIELTIGKGDALDLTAEIGITPDMLRNNPQMMTIMFARLGMTGTAADADVVGQTQVGPLRLVSPAKGLPQAITDALGKPDDDANS